jgi:hypothetical protein
MLEAISKIPIAAFQIFFLHTLAHKPRSKVQAPLPYSLPRHQRYELRNAPLPAPSLRQAGRLKKKSSENRLNTYF